MTDARKAGLAFMLGCVGVFLMVALHPTMRTPDLRFVSGLAHTIAFASFLLLFMGTWALTKLLAPRNSFVWSALVVYGFAIVAVTMAATVSGFIVPPLVKLMTKSSADASSEWALIITSLYTTNQAFAEIYAVAAGASIVLWSLASLRAGVLSKGIALYGCIASPLITLLIIVGHIRLDVHGMAAVALSEVIWFVGMGLSL